MDLTSSHNSPLHGLFIIQVYNKQFSQAITITLAHTQFGAPVYTIHVLYAHHYNTYAHLVRWYKPRWRGYSSSVLGTRDPTVSRRCGWSCPSLCLS